MGTEDLNTDAIEPVFGFYIPNLDDVTADPGDYDTVALTLKKVAEYMHTKGSAVLHRREGQISRAMEFERKCEAIYGALPSWARW